MNILDSLTDEFGRVISDLGINHNANASFQPANSKTFGGDYQTNFVLASTKIDGCSPKVLAQSIVDSLNENYGSYSYSVSGPGFINASLTCESICSHLDDLLLDETMGVTKSANPKTIVVDYSHPNIAKEMHVGHLRSTIIGDCIARVLEFKGEKVIRQNHIGDWGTPFGMLIAYLEESDSANLNHELPNLKLPDLEAVYRAASSRFSNESDFAEKSSKYTAMLQSGDVALLNQWRSLVDVLMAHCNSIYRRLDVSLRDEHIRGESAYNDDLDQTVSDLVKAGLVQESNEALCVFSDYLKDSEGNDQPVIVKKSDGGFLYSTTDLAAVRYRVNTLGADRLIYVVDSRQTLHLRQIRYIATEAEFLPSDVEFEHMPFGTMMDSSGSPFKTRDGGASKLNQLIDEAVFHAFHEIRSRYPDMPDDEISLIANPVGIGAIKYSDLSKVRTHDYKYDVKNMVSLEGNTALYIQYAYARIASILRCSDISQEYIKTLSGYKFVCEHERNLAIRLLRFAESVDTVSSNGFPHILCRYLYELTRSYMAFYENCPVHNCPDKSSKNTRLALCILTSRVLKTGLFLLGIKVLERI